MNYPLLIGWGGIRLFEATLNMDTNPANLESEVFVGEQASNAEMVMRRLKAEGFNCIRAYFEHAPYGQPDDRYHWNDEWFKRFVTLAKHYDVWVIVDYHGYREPYEHEDEWIGFWQTLISSYKDLYAKMVWGTCNEPITPYQGQQAIDEWTRLAQRWIDMCRGLGDSHWIVVSEVCWGVVGFPAVEWYPVVNDPLNKVFYDKHFYYDFYDDADQDPTRWTLENALARADHFYNLVVEVMEKYNRPFLCCEMGAFTGGEDPPDVLKCEGGSNHSPLSVAFLQRLINHFDTHSPRIGFMLWSAGDWVPLGLYGDWACWGNLLSHKPVPSEPVEISTAMLLAIVIILLALLAIAFKGGEK